LVCKVLQQQRLLDGFGHVTLRLPDDRILSTPKMPPGKVSMRDFIILNQKGEKVEGLGNRNGETPMHTAIYRARPDVQCILHFHPEELIAVSVVGGGIKVVANCGVAFHRGTPTYDSPLLINTEALGEEVAQVLKDHNAFLLRGHGATVVAENLDELLRLGINLVKTARIQLMATTLGNPKVHTQEESKTILKTEDAGGVIRRFLDYYISEAMD
jgi:ribulose-5-phosphate 4-epimerase/fuculose-1-phosphate aldolase